MCSRLCAAKWKKRLEDELMRSGGFSGGSLNSEDRRLQGTQMTTTSALANLCSATGKRTGLWG